MKRFFFLLFVFSFVIFAKEQNPKVQAALNDINKKLAKINNFSAKFTVDINSIKGKVHQSGEIIQKPPYAFKRDMNMKAMGGIMNVREITVSDGKTGWQIEFAPNGKAVNVSKWGEDAMEELFYTFLAKAYFIMLTDDKTNTYSVLFDDSDFTKAVSKDGGYVFTGAVDKKSQKYQALLKLAAALGEDGISTFMPEKVKLVIDKNGLAKEWIQYNQKGKPVVSAKLSDIKVNVPLAKNVFSYKPPKDVIVMNIGKALQRNKIHIQHPLLKKKAPKIQIAYLGGKKITVKPGSQPVVLTFFASWSGNSRKYLKDVDKLYGKYNLRGVKFISVTDENDPKTIKNFTSTERLTLPIYIDKEKTAIKDYGIHVVPITFVINRKGIVTDVIEGNAPGTLSALKESIEKTLK